MKPAIRSASLDTARTRGILDRVQFGLDRIVRIGHSVRSHHRSSILQEHTAAWVIIRVAPSPGVGIGRIGIGIGIEPVEIDRITMTLINSDCGSGSECRCCVGATGRAVWVAR